MQTERKRKLETVVRSIVAKTAGALVGQIEVRSAISIRVPEGPLGDALREFVATALREKGLNVASVTDPVWPEGSPALLVTEPEEGEGD